jgi:hypothetical protein
MSEEIEIGTNLEANATEKPKKAKKEKAPKAEVVRDAMNGITRPAAGTKTGRVWDIADELSNSAGQPVARKLVMDKATAEGINEATIATQYSRWRGYNGLVQPRPVAAE